jgi:tellurite resistance-related uncharacterized protein
LSADREAGWPGLKKLPHDLAPQRWTREFSESTVPAALRRRHTTRPGVWGRIVVLRGLLRYRILEPSLEEHVLSSGCPGIVEPGVPHEVEPLGEVRFYVEFHHRAEQPAARQKETTCDWS